MNNIKLFRQKNSKNANNRGVDITIMVLTVTLVVGISLVSCQSKELSAPIQSQMSPQGITFSERTDPNTPSANLYIEYVDGTKTLLRQNVSGDNDWNFMDAQFSKDCKQVVFTGFEDTNGDNAINFDDKSQIFVSNADGSDIRSITPISAISTMASWSPDGTQIAYMSDRSGGEEVWISNNDGSNAHQVTSSANWAGHVHWSPNGDFIAFYSTDYDDSYLTVVNPDGSGYQRISPKVGTISGIFITRDNRIVFGIENTRYVVKPDGSELQIFEDKILVENRELCGWPEEQVYIN